MQCRFVILFFFQAADGIRDFHVTGVQTCALPISRSRRRGSRGQRRSPTVSFPDRNECDRSEERRVGKECRSGWSPDHEKKKKRDVLREVEGMRVGEHAFRVLCRLWME